MAMLPLTHRPPANKVMSRVYSCGQEWDVAQSPLEVAAMQDDALQSGAALMELTFAGSGGWNGKPVYLRPDSINAIGPAPWHSNDG